MVRKWVNIVGWDVLHNRQRHGLGIGGDGDPWFVVGKNLKDNVYMKLAL